MVDIHLKSDFRDYYDHCYTARDTGFDVTHRRLSRDGISRRVNLDTLVAMGCRVPPYGRVITLTPRIPTVASKALVVYTDQYAHAGEGKVLVTPQQALARHPYRLAMVYLPPDEGVGTSYRLLVIGRRGFWLRYRAAEDWRSNCGDGDIKLVEEVNPPTNAVSLPLYAVDFVRYRNRLYALDFNSAPGLSGTGIESIMRPPAIYAELQAWYAAKSMCATH